MRSSTLEAVVAADVNSFPLNVLITGGAGFLGSHLTERMVRQGHNVFCLDNLGTGRISNIPSRVRESGQFHFLHRDVVDPLPWGLPRFDEIYNLACPASPVHYQEDRLKTALTSSIGVWNMIQRAERDDARLFHASTSEIYGDPDVHPQRENYNGNVNPLGPRACYDEGKRFAETLLTDFAASSANRVVRIARIFNTYGPRMHPEDGRVVSNFVVQALKGEDITVYGSGKQTRSFCFVTDLISGFEKLMRSNAVIDGPVNLGNPTEITVEELARTVIDMVGSRSEIVYHPLPVDDPRRRKPDITRAQSLLGWWPHIALEDGLRETIEYFREIQSEEMRLSAPRGDASNSAIVGAL